MPNIEAGLLFAIRLNSQSILLRTSTFRSRPYSVTCGRESLSAT
jgi:hypothetical protein